MHAATTMPTWLPKDREESLSQRLERGDIASFNPCPFPMPAGDDLDFLFAQQIGLGHKNISYDPASGEALNFRKTSDSQAGRLTGLLRDFADAADGWLRSILPEYCTGRIADRVSLRTEEEATRKVRRTARDDLLHIDAFPSRPTGGARILRLFVNIHPTEPRVWATADRFGALLARFGRTLGLPHGVQAGWGQRLLGIFQPTARSPYDQFMLQMHHLLKKSDEYQERASKKFWTFPPGTAWLCFTDGLSYAELRGQFALEHSFFIANESLSLPFEAPLALLNRACGMPLAA